MRRSGQPLGRAWSAPDWIGSTILAALVAPLVAGVVIAGLFVIGMTASAVDTGLVDTAGGLFFGIVYGLVILVVAEIAGAPITLPIAFIVALLVRRAARMSPEWAAFHVGLLVVAALVVGTLTLVAMTGAFGPVGAFDTSEYAR